MFHGHVATFFAGHRVRRRDFDRGPIQEVAPGFHVLAVAPGPRTEFWVYVSVGGFLVTKANLPDLEFMVIAPDDREMFVERLAMTVHYHHTQTLGPGHSLPLGEPWCEGSTLDHALISLPYPFGPALERFPVPNGGHGHLLWELPITAGEREYKVEQGLDALEEQFERAGLRYWDFARDSVI